MRKLLKKYGVVPDKLVTDELRSYATAASHLEIAKLVRIGSVFHRELRYRAAILSLITMTSPCNSFSQQVLARR